MTTLNIKQPLPPNITGFTGWAAPTSNLIEWDPMSDPNLFSVNVYRSNTNDRDTAVAFGPGAGLATQYIDAVAGSGTTYYYWARTVNLENQATGNWTSGVNDGLAITTSYVTRDMIAQDSVSSLYGVNPVNATVSSWDNYETVATATVDLVEDGKLTVDFDFQHILNPVLANNSSYEVDMRVELTGGATTIVEFETPIAILVRGNATTSSAPFYQRFVSARKTLSLPAGTYTTTVKLKQVKSNAGTTGSISVQNINIISVAFYR